MLARALERASPLSDGFYSGDFVRECVNLCRVRWIVRGDIDGFFGLAVDNLVQLLLIDTLCRTVLGFPPELVYGRVLPAAAVSILVGNAAYAFQARALAARTGRHDVCALPYGINTVSLFAHVFLVMLPAKALAERMGAADPARIAWQAGLIATLATGIIELVCAFVAERVRKATPRAALLSTLAGIALGFISLGFLFRTFAHPIVGLTTLAIVMLTYFGRVRFRGQHPGRRGCRGARHAALLDVRDCARRRTAVSGRASPAGPRRGGSPGRP